MGRDKKITIIILRDRGLTLKWVIRVVVLKKWLKWTLAGATVIWQCFSRFWSDGG